MTKLKVIVGQKYLDERGHVREIIQVLGDRVAYVNLTLDEKRQKPVGTCPLNAFYQDTLLEEGVTFTKVEATLLKRLLAGYNVGPVGQSILNKLGSIVVLLFMMSAVGFGQQAKQRAVSHDETTAIVMAGASVGRRVCALHPEESVWLTHDGKTWDKYQCSTLVDIFRRNSTDLVRTYVDMVNILHGSRP